eukprot:11584920-Alexandrium_andersonii.AAC.1
MRFARVAGDAVATVETMAERLAEKFVRVLQIECVDKFVEVPGQKQVQVFTISKYQKPVETPQISDRACV